MVTTYGKKLKWTNTYNSIPQWQILIKAPGSATWVDYSQYFDFSSENQQGMITQNFGRQGSTAAIPLADYHPNSAPPNFTIKPMSQIQINNLADSRNVFSGIINKPQFVYIAPDLYTWFLHCVDYSIYANTSVIEYAYSGLTADQVVVDAVAQANCGITAATVANGGFVDTGPVIPFIQFQWQSLSQAMQQIMQYASQSSQYGWFVDENLNLHFYNQFQAPAPTVTITDDATYGAGSTTLAHMELNPMFAYEYDGTALYNQIYVIGSQISIPVQLEGPPTQVWTGDGSTSIFPLSYPILQENTAATFIGIQAFILVGGQAAEVGLLEVEQQNNLQITPWVIEQTTSGQWVLVSQSGPPAAGTVIELWYPYELPVLGVAADNTSINTYGHNFIEVVNDNTLLTQQACFARAQRELTEYSRVEERLTCYLTEDFTGTIQAGDLVHIHAQSLPDSQRSYALGLDDDFIVLGVTIMLLNTGYRQYQLQLLRVSTS